MPTNQPVNLQIKTLSADWNDRDFIMLHACFQLLTDCVEEEKLLSGHIDWTATDESKQIKLELEELYQWWKQRSGPAGVNGLIELQKEQYEQDDAMLIRLIKVRKHLWT